MKTMFSICIGVLVVFVSCSSIALAQENAVKTVNGGIINGKAISLPKPAYPESARIANVEGVVGVNVVIDEGGNVISAVAAEHYAPSAKGADGEKTEPVPADPALREAAEDAAWRARFSPTLLSGQPVRVKGMIMYNFTTSTPERADVPKTVTGGVLNGKASSLPSPVYPAAAKAVGAQGTVAIRVEIDEGGNIISATPVSGHPLLRAAAADAAREARFVPTLLNGQPIKVVGVLTYNFVLPEKGNQ